MISVSSSASLGHLMASQKSSAVAAVVVLLLFCQTISASPHGGRPSSTSSDTQQLLESKSRGGAGPAEVLLVEDDSSSSSSSSSALPLTMESLENRLVAKQPPVRMLRSSGALPQQMFYEDEEASEAAPSAVRIANPQSEQEQQQLSRLLAQYFRLSNGGSGGNRLPRRVSSTSKRAGKKRFLKVFEEVEVLTKLFSSLSLFSRHGRRPARLHSAHQQGPQL